MQQGNIDWDELDNRFKHTFRFVDDIPIIDVAQQVIKATIFEEVLVLVSSLPQGNARIQILMECYNICEELEDDDARDIHIPEYEGSRALKEPCLSSEKFL